LEAITIIHPGESLINKFNKTVSSIDHKYLNCVQENRKISLIRDTLLPKLMSGEIRVPLDQEGDCEEVS
jgi:type I restriction enzyme S subunit